MYIGYKQKLLSLIINFLQDSLINKQIVNSTSKSCKRTIINLYFFLLNWHAKEIFRMLLT